LALAPTTLNACALQQVENEAFDAAKLGQLHQMIYSLCNCRIGAQNGPSFNNIEKAALRGLKIQQHNVKQMT
jgi:hypothetical protein